MDVFHCLFNRRHLWHHKRGYVLTLYEVLKNTADTAEALAGKLACKGEIDLARFYINVSRHYNAKAAGMTIEQAGTTE